LAWITQQKVVQMMKVLLAKVHGAGGSGRPTKSRKEQPGLASCPPSGLSDALSVRMQRSKQILRVYLHIRQVMKRSRRRYLQPVVQAAAAARPRGKHMQRGLHAGLKTG
jgi:hypothetical protein